MGKKSCIKKNICNFAHAFAPVAKLVDAPDLGSGVSRRVGSSPIRRTREGDTHSDVSLFLSSSRHRWRIILAQLAVVTHCRHLIHSNPHVFQVEGDVVVAVLVYSKLIVDIWHIALADKQISGAYAIVEPKSVIRISLCRTAKRTPLIFPI